MQRTDFEKSVIMHSGREILNADTMKIEKRCIQHGKYSVYDHSLRVAALCVKIAVQYRIPVNMHCLVRGALLHDYFLYDWHEPDKSHRLHAFSHAKCALNNADRDFELTDIEKNMIKAHMFPMNLTFPKYRESVILCFADKICATQETVCGLRTRFFRPHEVLEL